ncbi:MAG: glycosyltransferase [Balneolaceae bacterium]
MISSILFWLLAFSLLYLIATSVVLIRNRFELTPLPSTATTGSHLPKISVCIPARNEEAVIGRLLQSIVEQSYPAFEILVLDDQSEDRTGNIIASFQERYPGQIRLLKGRPKPADWLGKPWACQQLGEAAEGDLLLFLDADTQMHSQLLPGVAAAFSGSSLDMITVWPRQKLSTFWEQTVVPLIYYALVTLLPAVYVQRNPRWMPPVMAEQFKSRFAAACGQCIAFRKESYKAIGGHAAVKDQIVEDVELAKVIKSSGMMMRMYEGTGTITCRMYTSNREIFQGLRKNFFIGFNRSLPLFVMMALLHLTVFVLPVAVLLYAIAVPNAALFFLSISCITLVLMHRLLLARWFGWNPLYAFTHPLGVLWFQWLGITTLSDFIRGKSVTWKGRSMP